MRWCLRGTAGPWEWSAWERGAGPHEVVVREGAQSGDEGISSEASNSPAPPQNGDMGSGGDSSSPNDNNQVDNHEPNQT